MQEQNHHDKDKILQNEYQNIIRLDQENHSYQGLNLFRNQNLNFLLLM